VVRPLLRASRADVLAYARGRGLAWREDPSNADPRYARSRLRHAWLPGLARDFNPALLRAIGDLAEAQRRESEWTATLVEREVLRRFEPQADGSLRIEAKDWGASAVPEALARRLARVALHEVGAGRDVTRAHLERVVRFWRSGRPGTSIELPDGLRLERDVRGFSLARGLPYRGGC
jgi:tRNA(Ile)-lysidine synthase